MRALLTSIFVALLSVTLLAQQPPKVTGSISTAGADCSVATRCVSLSLGQANGTLIVDLSGTWTGTILFEVSADNARWLTPVVGTTSATVNGTYAVAIQGFQFARARASALAVPPLSVTLSATAQSFYASTTVTSTALPTGAATAALQTQPGVDIGDVTINNAAGASAVNIQDGGNSITIDATSLPLPTGASTLAEQQTQTTALQLIDNIVSGAGVNITQVGGTNIATNTGIRSAGTQRVTVATDDLVPISAASLPLPTGASTLAEQQTQTTALQLIDNIVSGAGANITQMGGTNVAMNTGTRSAGTQRVTIATDDLVPVSGTVTTSPPANASTNVAQLAGTTTDTNSGTKSAGTLRVVLATDQPALTNKLLVTPDSVALPANQSVNTAQFGGTNVSTGTGAGGVGIPRVTISNDSSLAANQSVNVAQVNGVTTLANLGPSGTGSQRVSVARDDMGGSTTITSTAACPAASATAVASNSACIVIPLAGYSGAGLQLQAGTLAATLQFEYSTDGGTTFSASYVILASAAAFQATSIAVTNPNGAQDGTWIAGSAWTHVRVRCSAFTSGSAVVVVKATQIVSPLAVGAIQIGVSGLPLPLFTSVTAGSDGANTRNLILNNTFPTAATYGVVVRPIDGLAAAVTLQASQVSGVANATTTRTTTTGLDRCGTLQVLVNVTAGGTATGTLQLYLQDSPDAGTTWDDIISSNTFALGAAVTTQRFFITKYLQSQELVAATATTVTQGSAVKVETLGAGATRQGPWGDRIRVREKVSGVSGSPVGATYTITAMCKG